MNLLGKISLILSLFSFLLTLGFKIALNGWMPFMFFGFGFGLFFLIFAVAVNFKNFKALMGSKPLHFLAKNSLTLGLTILLLGALNYIFSQKPLVFDLTDNKIHSLSSFTRELINSLDEEVNFYYLHVDNERVMGYKSIVKKEVEKFRILNPKIHFESYSVFKRPDLAKRFGVIDDESSLLVEYKGRVQRIYQLGEKAFVNALLKLIKTPKKLYFLQLKDERELESPSTFGLKGFKQQLERLHYQLDTINSLEKLPGDMAVLALVGSRKPFSEEERGQLNLYLKKGGALFVALDPGEDHKLNPLLKNYGVQVEDHFVFADETQVGQSRLMVFTHKGESQHRVIRGLEEGQNPVLFLSSSVSVLDKASMEADRSFSFKVTPLLEHLPTSRGYKDIDPSSPVVSEGRLWASVMSEGQGKEKNFRLAVVADSDFITNQFYSKKANFDFAFNLFSYLSQDEDLLKIKPGLSKTTHLILTQTQMNHYFIFFILPFPFVFFILSVFFKLRGFF